MQGGSEEYQALQKAFQDFVNAKEEQPSIITSAIILWEVMVYEDGEPSFGLDYSQVSETASLATALGLCEAGALKMKNIITGSDKEME